MAAPSAPLRSGERTSPTGKPVANKILLGMPEREFLLLRPHVEYVDLPQKCTLHRPDSRPKFLYFPNSGLLSLIVSSEQGRTVEVAVVGNEGLAGSASVAGLRRSTLLEVVQISGDGFRVRAEALEAVLKSAPHLQRALYRYSVLLSLQVAQTAACNRLHNIEQRLARWLLMTQDRVDSGTLKITHDFLATMLGTDRPSVSTAAAALQNGGMIHYVRGAVKITDRKKLEDACCECYGIIQQLNGE